MTLPVSKALLSCFYQSGKGSKGLLKENSCRCLFLFWLACFCISISIVCVRFLAYYAQLSDFGYFIVKCSWDQRSNQKKKYFSFLKDQKAHIYYLQETFSEPNDETQQTTNPSKGVCILVNSSFQYQVEHSYSDNSGRIVLITIILDSQKVTSKLRIIKQINSSLLKN